MSSQSIEHALLSNVAWGYGSRCECTEPAILGTLFVDGSDFVLYAFREGLEEFLSVVVFTGAEEGVGSALGLGA